MTYSDYTVATVAQLYGQVEAEDPTESHDETGIQVKRDQTSPTQCPKLRRERRLVTDRLSPCVNGQENQQTSAGSSKAPINLCGVDGSPTPSSPTIPAFVLDISAAQSPDTPDTTPGQSISRKDSKITGDSKFSDAVQNTDIYFSPIEASRSQVFLSSPLPSPPILPATTFVLKEKAVHVDDAQASSPPPTRKPAKNSLTITPKHIDQLVVELVHAPLVQKHIRRQYWDTNDVAGEQTLGPASEGQEDPKDKLLKLVQSSAQTISSVLEQKADSVALLDAKVDGAPITYISKPAAEQDDSLTASIGKCTFQTVPIGTSNTATLQIHPPQTSIQLSKITIHVTSAAIGSKSGQRESLLTTEFDVTRSFAKAALAELAAYTGLDLDDIGVVLQPPSPLDEGSIDWIALADEMQIAAEAADAVDAVVASIRALKAETCAMATLTLLSELARIKAGHADFVVLTPKIVDDKGEVRTWRIPVTSQALASGSIRDGRGEGGLEVAKRFMQEAVNAVAAHALQNEEFEARCLKVRARLRGVPLFGDVHGRASAWCVFVLP